MERRQARIYPNLQGLGAYRASPESLHPPIPTPALVAVQHGPVASSAGPSPPEGQVARVCC